MEPGKMRGRLAARALAFCCLVAGSAVFAADAPRSNAQLPKQYPLTVEPIPAVTRDHHVRLEGHAAPKQQITVAGGSAPATTRADSHGEFHAEIALTNDRTNTLVVATTDPAASANVSIMQDSTAPQIVIDSPREDAVVYKPGMHVTGQVTDNLSGVMSVNCGDVAATVSGTQFSCDMPVGDTGGHHIKIWSADAAGNISVARRRVVSAPPLSGGDAHTVVLNVDINGDRHVDVVRTDFLAGEVVIRLGNGDGTFQAERHVAVGPYPSSVAVADINKDGILDLITTHYTTSEASIQYGQPDGSYVQGPRVRVGMWPSAIAVADMNNDGKLDLITAHLHDGGLVRVHVRRDDGSFAAESSAGVGKDPQGLAVGDVHGDGKLDVVVANYASNDVSLLRGRGNGHFYSERPIEVNASAVGPTAISLGDLDGDGVLDIATANFGSNEVTVLSGIGQGAFKPAQGFAVASQPIAVTILEVTGDDKLDVVTENLGSSAVLVLPSRPDGMFAALEPLRSPAPVVIQMPRRADPGPVLTSDPTIPATVQAAEMPSTSLPVVRAPVAGLPAPMDRIGQSFGGGDSDYGFLMGPNGMSYQPLLAMGKVGVKWIRLEGDAGYFTNPQAYASTAKTVDDLIARGYNIHFVVSHWLKPWPTDFPNKDFLSGFAQFAGTLAAATHRPGRVIFEIWNEPNDIGDQFWPKPRKGVNEAFMYARILTEATEAIHMRAPGAVVMSGGLFTYSGSYGPDMLAEYNRLRANRPLAMVDIFALHPYPQGADGFDPMRLFRNDLNRAGFGGVPLHISEMAGWWCTRECVGAWNANNLLHAIEEDVPHINFWGVLSSSGFDAPGSFMDKAVSEFDSCMQSIYASVPNVVGFKCHPSMYMLGMFKRAAQGRTYQGAIFDSRNVASLPGGVPGDPMSGLRALRFESADDVVIAVYTMDRLRGTIPNSGKAYSIAFPDKPIYAASYTGQDYTGLGVDGRYTITHDTGPAYFFFSKTGQLPGQTVVANAVCADGSLPRRGRLQLWHTAWPYNGPSSVLNWLTPGPSDAGTVVTVSDQLPLFVSNMYVYAEVADGSGRVLEVRSGVQTAGGPGTPKVVINKFFSPPTSMVELAGPSLANGVYRVEYLALPEWCTP